MKDFLIFGGGGHCASVVDAAREAGMEVSAILDDNPKAKSLMDIDVFATEDFSFPKEFQFVVAIGRCAIRRDKYEWLLEKGGEPETIIHPRAWVSKWAKIGKGSIILPMASIDPCVTIGENVTINIGASIGHDSLIRSHSHIAVNVGLSSGTTIGEGAWIGIGSSTVQSVKVGDWSTVGAGSVVTRDIPANVVAFGSPAHRNMKAAKGPQNSQPAGASG